MQNNNNLVISMNLVHLYMDIICDYALCLDKDHNAFVFASL